MVCSSSMNNRLGKVEHIITHYQYDEAGNEIAQIDALGRTNSFAYDGLGRRIVHTRPDSQTEYFYYDWSGNLTNHTDFLSKNISQPSHNRRLVESAS
jgi:YD repeat-containing protein